MRLLTLPCVVLLCASIAQATPVGTTIVYDFNNLSTGINGMPLYGQVDGPVTWDSVHTQHQNIVQARVLDPSDPNNVCGTCNATNGEQLITAMTDPNVQATLFNLDPTDTKLRLSYEGYMNGRAGWLVGIWVDGIDAYPNTTDKNEAEHAVQFGLTHVTREWRIRGANFGTPSVTDGLGMPMDPLLSNNLMKLILDVDLLANGGNGSMSLTVQNLSTGTTYYPPALQDVSMGLAGQHPYMADPSKWTGWYIRNQRLTGGDDPANSIGYHTVDNLTLEVIPEPATLSLLVLGGLACLRRRR